MIDIVNSTHKPAYTDTPGGIAGGIKGGKKDVPLKMRHISGSSLQTAIRFYFACFGVAAALDAAAASTIGDGFTNVSIAKTRLTSTEITRLFSDVIDRGEVQDQRGISAETHWHADGTFVSRWWTEVEPANDASHEASHEGALKQQVSGRWRTERDLRCVTFDSGAQPDWSCAEVWLLDDGRVLSLDPDGNAHGLHRLSPLK